MAISWRDKKLDGSTGHDNTKYEGGATSETTAEGRTARDD